jgi:cytochrome c556
MPAAYVALQAEFDEAARELAVAARLNQLHETSRRFDEMERTCRRCHETYHVTLEPPYADVSGGPRSE